MVNNPHGLRSTNKPVLRTMMMKRRHFIPSMAVMCVVIVVLWLLVASKPSKPHNLDDDKIATTSAPHEVIHADTPFLPTVARSDETTKAAPPSPSPPLPASPRVPSSVAHLTMTTFYDNQWVVRTTADFTPTKKQGGGGAYAPQVLTSPNGKNITAPPSFYKGKRKVPSLDWIEIFMRSLAHHTFYGTNRRSSGDTSSTSSKLLPGGLLFFVDPFSAILLRKRVVDLVEGGFVLFVGVCPPSNLEQLSAPITIPASVLPANLDVTTSVAVDDNNIQEEGAAKEHGGGGGRGITSLKAALAALGIPVVSPKYLDEEWVTGVPNGANNFRFALYQDWLSGKMHHEDSVTSIPSVVSFIKRQGADIGRMKVLISDSTDVAFQANPFISYDLSGNNVDTIHDGIDKSTSKPSRGCFSPNAGPKQHSITFTLETASKNFKNEKYNRKWMSCYDTEGSNMLKKMEAVHAPISCAGVTLGTSRGILAYLGDQLTELYKPALIECASATIKATLDQATHNVLLFQRRQRFQGMSPPGVAGRVDEAGAPVAKRKLAEGGVVDAVRIARHEDDHCVFHGNFGKLKMVERDSTVPLPSPPHGGLPRQQYDGYDMVAVNAHNVPYLIVHQYSSDRHPRLMKVLRARYL